MVTKFKCLTDLQKVFPTEESCIKYLEKHRWRGIITSPFDPTSKVYKCKKNNKYKCKNTNRYFNAKTGTIFENSKIPLQKWFWVLFAFSSDKKGISSYQIVRDIGITQKSAWFVLHRLRVGFECPIFKSMLGNEVEVDETYLGGSNPNRHWDKKVPRCQGRSWKDKTPILVMIERKGNVIAQVVPNTQKENLEPIIKENIKQGSNVYTDEWLAYNELYKTYKHEIVNHRIKQYVNGEASTNSAENFNSHLKRMIYGTYHWISKKHMQKYIDEFVLRFNTRKHEEKDRFNLALSSMVDKRLTYQQLIS